METTAVIEYCDKCGRQLKGSYVMIGGMKICPICQMELHKHNNLCTACGTNIDNVPEPPYDESQIYKIN